ncbi:hypothetical protein IGI04_036176 [Brassica rapa subsp. trilocularis]|uniref:Uncharacterized protein n=1 Tax=Brassica rapa subsp. trilocularis TaxID=1813537 RepID=A0ABQ7LDQ9_BRACM|nr:hypothetical protein IGI04_036176 [Brassica rapa subsp. trilocularis]
MHELVSYRRFGRVRSLCNDRTERTLGRYVATKQDGRLRPSGTDARSLRSDRAVCMLGRRVSIELGMSVVRLPYSSLSAAELDTCLFPSDNRYLVVRLRFEQDFTARLFVKISLQRLLFRKNVEADFYGLSGIDSVMTDFDPNTIIRRIAADGILYGCRGKTTSCHLILEYWQRDKFWDLISGCLILCLEMLETSALGLGQDLGLLLVLEGAMTNSTYVSRFSFILIPYRFKVRDRFSAYTTCMVGIEHLSRDRKCWTKISDFFYSAIILVSDVRDNKLNGKKYRFESSRRICFEKMLVCMTVWSSKKMFLSRKEISSKNESSGVCDVSRC